MKLRQGLLRFLAEKGIIPHKKEYETDSEREFSDWIESEREKLARGEDIEPPWIQFNGISPWSGAWKQGRGSFWSGQIWGPFWSSLSEQAKQKYLEKWQPPDEEWNEYINLHWWNNKSDNDVET